VRTVFNIEDANEVLHPEELAKLGVQTEVSTDGHVLEWKIEQYLTGWKETSNGLQYQLARLEHRFLDSRTARGKCYELRHLTTAERAEVETHLRRHVEVCDRIGDHPNIARNLTAAYVNNLWWVLDVWEAGETLGKRLQPGPVSEYELQFIMTGIANGLARLHDVEIIRRELTPDSIILLASSDRPVLTDMELAKIAESGVTVSPQEWPDDPYRALEVTGNTPIDQRADLYSWGRLFIHGATGILQERGAESLPSGGFIPESVREIVLQSVELLPDDRPKDMKVVLKALKGWI
jgi:serine/threonine protein kinase